MKKLLIVSLALSLIGCNAGYSYDQLEKAKKSCLDHSGEFKILKTGQLVTATRCKIGNMVYRISRNDNKLYDSYIVE